jgi:hypothetical protein
VPRTDDGSEGFCPECGKDVDPGRAKKFCSEAHRTSFSRGRYGRGLERSGLARKNGRGLDRSELAGKKWVIGTIQETRVVIDLLQKGFEVFRAAVPSALDDLWISKKDDDRLLRVQVKTGHLQQSNIIISRITQPESGRHDVLAVPLDVGEIQYEPAEMAEWGKRPPALGTDRTIACTRRVDGRRITGARVDVGRRKINVCLRDGTSFEAPLSPYRVLSEANDEDLSRVCWPYGGRVVRWPRLDFEKTADELFRGK